MEEKFADKIETKSLRGHWRGIFDFVKFIIITALIVIPVRLWIAQPFLVSGASMEPTFNNGNYLIIDELSYHLRKPKKNEVVVFRYPNDPSKFFIKRIAGAPGETVVVQGRETILKDDEYYVLGDNRGASSDSRTWGPVREKLIIGRTLVRLWPFGKIELFPGYK